MRCSRATERTRSGSMRCRWARWTCRVRGRPELLSALNDSCNVCGATWSTKSLLHKTIDTLRTDYDGLRFNTAIARLIEFNNALTKLPHVPREAAEALVVMTAPVAPHIAEELWAKLGHTESLTFENFPTADPAMLVDDTVTCVVQIQGKLRDRLEVAPDISDEELEAQALASDKVIAALAGKLVRKVIVRAPTLVNIVAS